MQKLRGIEPKQAIKQLVKFVARCLGYELMNVRSMWGVEPWKDVDRIRKNRKPSTIFDVGANLGQTAISLGRRYNQADIYSFEPVSATFEVLKERTKPFSGIHVYNLGLGAEAGTKEMYVYGDNSKVNSFRRDTPSAIIFQKKSVYKKIPANITTVDSFCETHDIRVIDILKTDAEGFDLEVLQGANRILRRGAVRFVYCEFNNIGEPGEASAGDLWPIHKLLSSNSFHLVAIYTDYVLPEYGCFAVHNALYAHSTELSQIDSTVQGRPKSSVST